MHGLPASAQGPERLSDYICSAASMAAMHTCCCAPHLALDGHDLVLLLWFIQVSDQPCPYTHHWHSLHLYGKLAFLFVRVGGAS